MRELSLFLVVALLLSLLASCNSINSNSNGAEEMENDGLHAPIDSITHDSDEETVPGIFGEPEVDSELSEGRDETAGKDSDPSVDTDFTDDNEGSISNETDAEESGKSESSDETHETETETDIESATPEYSETIEPPVISEPETEAYDGMEVVVSEAQKLISEAKMVGITYGYSVAAGSARIIQPKKDNPNIIQVVFETDNPDIRIAINYHRKSEGAQWKLINGVPVSVLKSEETDN